MTPSRTIPLPQLPIKYSSRSRMFYSGDERQIFTIMKILRALKREILCWKY